MPTRAAVVDLVDWPARVVVVSDEETDITSRVLLGPGKNSCFFWKPRHIKRRPNHPFRATNTRNSTQVAMSTSSMFSVVRPAVPLSVVNPIAASASLWV
jgi:hypothetical protein